MPSGLDYPLHPPPGHPCWEQGWVKCDYLPRFIEMRFDGSSVDFTDTGRPGVYPVVPTMDDWTLKYKFRKTVQHPNAGRSVPYGGAYDEMNVKLTRCQIPLAPELVGTYNNQQGKTCRDPSKKPLGHSIDLRPPAWMTEDEKKTHFYMILGRATKLSYTLLYNFPTYEDGSLDWSLFESGPPPYLIKFLDVLEQKAKNTIPVIEAARVSLSCFPRWHDIPRCQPGSYDREAWASACAGGGSSADGVREPVTGAVVPCPLARSSVLAALSFDAARKRTSVVLESTGPSCIKRPRLNGRAYQTEPRLAIYFESQSGALCGLHALNNAVGGGVFTSIHFDQAAADLVTYFATSLGVVEPAKDHLSPSGDYSIALMHFVCRGKSFKTDRHGLASVMLDQSPVKPVIEEVQSLLHPDVVAFIVNIGNHWIAIKNINGRIWLMDSRQAGPIGLTMSMLVDHTNQFPSTYMLMAVPSL